jgi:hypothetical protein
MTQHPRAPIAATDLRGYRGLRTLALALAVAGSVACNGEGPTGLHSPISSGRPQLLVPSGVSLLTLAEVNSSIAEVENMRVSLNGYNASMGYPMDPIPALSYPATISLEPPAYVPPAYVPPPTGEPTELCPGCMAYSRSVGEFAATTPPIPKTRASGKVSPQAHFLFVGCPGGGYQCEQHCTELRNQTRALGADYWRAYREFVTNFFPEFWRVPENFFIGGPRDQMRTVFRQIYLTKLTYDADCVNGRPSGGGGGSGFSVGVPAPGF